MSKFVVCFVVVYVCTVFLILFFPFFIESFAFIQVNTALKFLFLDKNEVADTGASAILQGIHNNRSLTNLQLWGNAIADIGIVQAESALRENSGLLTLSFGEDHMWHVGNSIGATGSISLARGLQDNSTLTRLELNHNCIDNAGIIAIGESLAVHATYSMNTMQ